MAPAMNAARRQHQRGVRREINCDFDPVSARTHTDCAALPVRCQQNHRHRQDVRQQIRKRSWHFEALISARLETKNCNAC